MCTLIIDLIECVIAFLSRCVPYGELYLVALGERNCLGETTCVNRADLLVVEAALTKTQRQRRLAHARYTNGLRSAILFGLSNLAIIGGYVDLPSPSTTILKEAEVFSIC